MFKLGGALSSIWMLMRSNKSGSIVLIPVLATPKKG